MWNDLFFLITDITFAFWILSIWWIGYRKENLILSNTNISGWSHNTFCSYLKKKKKVFVTFCLKMWSQRNGQLRPKTSWVAGFYFIALPCSLLLPVPNADGPDVFVWARGSGEGGGGGLFTSGSAGYWFPSAASVFTAVVFCFALFCFFLYLSLHAGYGSPLWCRPPKTAPKGYAGPPWCSAGEGREDREPSFRAWHR